MPVSDPKIVSREEWLAARKTLFAKEKELTHLRDAVSAARRALPWVKVEKTYAFDAPEGRVALADLFGPRSQLAVYHFMLTPGSDHICPGCSFIADHVDAARQHFEEADLSFAAIARAPLARIEEVKRRMGWRFRWVSSHGSDFNYDFGVSFTKEDIQKGRAIYNYGTKVKSSEDLHGTSIFAKDAKGQVFHTYSTFARGDEMMIGAFSWLDLAPRGRNETGGAMSWVKLHDEYTGAR
ncbi:MAG: thioredoxin family protein [Alphaproteobacteria bacterium]